MRYEEFANDNELFLRKLLAYMRVDIPENELMTLILRHKFENYSKGRTAGVENKLSHYRRGKSGDWMAYFNDKVNDHMSDVTGDLIRVLGYDL